MCPVATTRWCPTPEQLMILEEMYRGGVRTPNATQIQQITAHLSLYGKIEGKNVFYWFQNHKARDRQKLRRRLTKHLILQHQHQQHQNHMMHHHHHQNQYQQNLQQLYMSSTYHDHDHHHMDLRPTNAVPQIPNGGQIVLHNFIDHPPLLPPSTPPPAAAAAPTRPNIIIATTTPPPPSCGFLHHATSRDNSVSFLPQVQGSTTATTSSSCCTLAQLEPQQLQQEQQMLRYTWRRETKEEVEKEKPIIRRSYGDDRDDWMIMSGADRDPNAAMARPPLKTLELFPITTTTSGLKHDDNVLDETAALSQAVRGHHHAQMFPIISIKSMDVSSPAIIID